MPAHIDQVKAYTRRPAERRKLEEQIRHTEGLKAERAFYQKQLAELTLQGGQAGMLVDIPEIDDIGRYIRVGDPLGKVVSGRWLVRALMSQQDIAHAQPAVGQQVAVRLAGQPGTTYAGTVLEIRPGGSEKITLPALTSMAA